MTPDENDHFEVPEGNTLDELRTELQQAAEQGRISGLESFWNRIGSPRSEEVFRELLEIALESCSQFQRDVSFEDAMKLCRGIPFDRERIRTIFDDWKATRTTGQSEDVSATTIHPASDFFPKSVGRYEIREILGKGGFGTVYRAWDPRLEREVALKVPHPYLLDDAQVRERFLREARAVSKIRHPGLCPIYEIHEHDDGTLFLSLAYIKGSSLAQALKKRGRLAESDAATIVRKIALAVHEAHENGVLHRDLKPANVLIPTDESDPVVTDFGLARRTLSSDETLTEQGALLGTPAYMSPEQARGDSTELGVGTDVYSLGVVLYELLSGRRPFTGRTMDVITQILRDAPQPLREIDSTISPEIAAICERAIAKRSEDRFTTLREFAEALDQFLTEKSSSEWSEPTVLASPIVADDTRKLLPRPVLNRRNLIITGCSLVLMLGVLVLIWRPWNQRSDVRPENSPGNSSAIVPATDVSPIVGRWRVFSSRTGNVDVSLDFRDDGRGILYLAEQAPPSTAMHSRNESIPERAEIPIGYVLVQREDNQPNAAPDANQFEEQQHIRMQYDIANTGPVPGNYLGFHLGDDAEQFQLTWTNELTNENFIFPVTELGVYPIESWNLVMTDQNHCYGSRTRSTNLDSGEKDNAALNIHFDQIALVRESAGAGDPLPPQHWLSSQLRYGADLAEGRVAYAFLPDGQLFLAIDQQNPVGGRKGVGAARMTYRVLSSDSTSVKLEVRTQSTRPGEDRVRLWDALSFSSREIWTCTLEKEPQRSPWNARVRVEQQTRVIEIRQREDTVYEDVGGKKIPKTVTESYGVEVPVVKTFILEPNP